MRIVVDAMGSDNNPVADVAGAVMAAREFGDEIIVVGDAERIGQELAKHDLAGLQLTIQHAGEAITMEDIPSEVARSKPDSSAHVGLGLVRDGAADAFVSAGNTGGLLAVATLKTLRRIPGVKRPALGIIFPIANHPLLIDGGANADVRPDWLYQFAVMGSIYVERVNGVKAPRVALISNGEEEGKGNQLIKETIPLLAESGLNYIGNIEPKEFLRGEADVVVTDGFTGNMILKTTEATASMMSEVIREAIKANPITAIGGLLAKPAFAKVRKLLSSEEVGGAPLLGVNGPMIIGHGRSDAYAIKQAVGQARKLVEQDIVGTIREGLKVSG
ncbi:MAG: phosphate acyltransferase PlsX [Anaerolineales bacterium]|nr:phosphate acyltransferase PlsX [Anaerolineales bacterium]